MIEPKDRDTITRRRFVAGAGLAGAAGPFVWTHRAGAAGKVIIRTIGGSYEEATVKAIFEPFTKATGIEVVKVPATLGKVLAMHEAGNMELDVMDAGELGVFSLSQKGALDKINYKAWKLTNPDDIDPAVRRDDMVADIFFSSVLGYNNQTFPTGKQPRSWAEFWDIKKFSGPRMLADIASGAVDLEFALLADGVPKDKLYPLDVPRALKSLDRIKGDIKVWWSQFPQPGVLLKSGEITATPWTRSISFVLEGEPMGISYEGGALTYEAWVVPKGAPHTDNAMKFINFALQPKPQAELTKYIAFGPTNSKATPLVDPKLRPLLSSDPDNVKKGFLLSGDWWGPNLDKVNEKWNEWRLA